MLRLTYGGKNSVRAAEFNGGHVKLVLKDGRLAFEFDPKSAPLAAAGEAGAQEPAQAAVRAPFGCGLAILP